MIRNASTQWHPFHIHINDYQVVAINGEPVRVRSNEDTTRVPPFGEITMRTRYLDFPGRWVYHCHILLHEDHGMMGTVQCRRLACRTRKTSVRAPVSLKQDFTNR